MALGSTLWYTSQSTQLWRLTHYSTNNSIATTLFLKEIHAKICAQKISKIRRSGWKSAKPRDSHVKWKQWDRGLLLTYTNIQFPTDSHALHDQLYITVDLIRSVEECMKVLLWAFKSASVFIRLHSLFFDSNKYSCFVFRLWGLQRRSVLVATPLLLCLLINLITLHSLTRMGSG